MIIKKMSMKGWLPFSYGKRNNYPRNYNNLDRPKYATGGEVESRKARPVHEPYDVPYALSAMQYGYGGGIYNKPISFPPPNNGRSLQQVASLDYGNYYNSRK
jgi:hypothetical protein